MDEKEVLGHTNQTAAKLEPGEKVTLRDTAKPLSCRHRDLLRWLALHQLLQRIRLHS